MKIGLISDTHDRMDHRVHDIFKGVQLIIHAGDVCNPDIITELETIAPVTMVLGNNDFALNGVHVATPILEDVQFLVVHILDSPLARREISRVKPAIVIYGHTHVPKDEEIAGIRYINPGSLYRGRQGAPRSLAILDASPRAMELEFFSL